MKRKALYLATGIIIAFSASSFAQSQEAESFEYVYVKVTQGSGNWTKVFVVYPDGTTEMTELKIGTAKNHESNSIQINSVFNKLGKKGYRLATSNGGEYHSQFVFVK